MKFNKKLKGSFTLEAMIIMSSIIMIIFAVLYAFMILYQNVLVTYTATVAAQQCAANWGRDVTNLDTGDGTPNNEEYYRLQEFGNSQRKSNKLSQTKKYAEKKLAAGILPTKNSNITVKMENGVFQRSVSVEIKQEIDIPFKWVIEILNDGDALSIDAKVTAMVAEPTEYIRNCDYAVEIATTLTEWINKKLNISNGFEKIEGAISSVSN